MSAEQRRSRRAVPGDSVAVHDAVSRHQLGVLGNLSVHGLMVITTAPVEEDLLFQLEFEVTAPDGGRVVIAVGAESLWCSPASQPERYWAGFEIVDVSDEVKALLQALTS